MKKALSILLALTMILSVFTIVPFEVFAAEKDIAATGEIVASGTTGACTWTLDENGTLTISGNGEMEDYFISGIVQDANIAPWVDYNITKAIIEDGVTYIGKFAFCQCSNLSSVVISDSVKRIGAYAFYSTGLTSVTIPDSVTDIDYNAFFCSSLTSVIIGNSVKKIDINAFSNCPNLASITIPDSVEYIGGNAFDNTAWYENQPDGLIYIAKIAYKLKGKHFYEGVIRDGTIGIAGSAFVNCKDISALVIPDSVKYIGSGAFTGCINLSDISIPDAVTIIDNFTFYGCTSLTSITIPDTVTSIGRYAFYECENLSSVNIPDSVEAIGQEAFCGCSNLTSVTIPASVTSIGSEALGYIGSGKVKGFTIHGYAGSAAETYANENGFTFVEISTIIASGTTGDCTWTLDENGLLTISGNGAMGNEGNRFWGREITCVVIEDGVTSIGDSAFDHCQSLNLVTIPNSLTSIGYRAFRSCNNLDSVTIPDSVTSIGKEAFRDCHNLVSVTISDSVTSIDSSTFRSCLNLTLVTIPDSVTSMGDYAFDNCLNLSAVYIPSSVIKFGRSALYGRTIMGVSGSEAERYANEKGYRFYTTSGSAGSLSWSFDLDTGRLTIFGEGAMDSSPWKDFGNLIITVVIENGVTNIGNSEFYDCLNLCSVTIPQSVTSIGDSAFYNCYNMSLVMIPDSVTSIGEKAFGYRYSDAAIDGFTISGTAGTAAETYANKNDIIFVELEHDDPIIPGDINNDGKANNKDATRLMQYLAHWEVEVNEAVLDTNGDGKINNKDVTRLMQYLAHWDVVLYPVLETTVS